EAVYDRLADIPIDPFSPGFYAFFDRSADVLDRMRSRAIALLISLESTDAGKKDLYARRRADFESLAIAPQTASKRENFDKTDLRSLAINAVDAGDVAQLEKVIEKLRQEPAPRSIDPDEVLSGTAEAVQLADDLAYSFADSTLIVAERLGLARART